jgi:DNA-binding SARP family transcriptional activator
MLRFGVEAPARSALTALVLLARDEDEGNEREIRMLWRDNNEIKLSEDGLTGYPPAE